MAGAEYIELATRWIRLACKCGDGVEFSTHWRQANLLRAAFLSAHSAHGHGVSETTNDEGYHE